MQVLLEELKQILLGILTKGKVGTLSLGRKERQRDIFFEPGSAYLLNRGNLHRIVLSEELTAVANFAEDDLMRVAVEARETGETLPEVLRRRGFVNDELHERLLEVQIREETLDAIFTCRGSFVFFEGVVPEDLLVNEGYAARVSIDREEFGEALAKREAQLARLAEFIPSHEEVFVSTEKGLAARATRSGFAFTAVYDLIDGFRTVRQISQDAPFYEYRVLAELGGFLTHSLIKKTLLPELRGVSVADLEQAEAERYLPLFERSVAHAMDELGVREKLAAVYEKVNRKDSAREQFELVGDRYAQLGKNEKAVKSYLRALNMDPGRGEVKAKIGIVFVREAQEAAAAGNRRRSIELLNHALRSAPGHGEIYRQLATHFRESGDRPGLRRLVDLAVKHGRSTGDWQATKDLAAGLGDISAVDPGLEKRMANLLAEIEAEERTAGRRTGEAARTQEGAATDKREPERGASGAGHDPAPLRSVPAAPALQGRARRKAWHAGARIWHGTRFCGAVCAGMLVVLVAVYQTLALLAYHRVASAQNLNERLSHYRDLPDRYPLTIGGLIASRKAREMEDIRSRQLKERWEHVTELVALAEASERVGDLDGARKLYAEVARDAPEDLASRARERLRTLDANDREADGLLARAQERDAAGDPAAAFMLARKLVDSYAATAAARRAVFPVRIESAPTGAEVWIDGVKRGVAPMVHRIPAGERPEIKLSLRGHKPLVAIYEPGADPVAAFSLSREELWMREFPAQARSSLLVHGDLLYVAGSNGTLGSLTLDGGVPRATVKVPDATDIVAGPVSVGALVAFATNDGRVCSVDQRDAFTVWATRELIASPLIPIDDSVVCFATTKQRVKAMSLRDGRILWEVPLSSPARGAACRAGGVVVFLCRDDVARAFVEDGGAMRWERRVAPASELAPAGPVVLIGGPQGASLLDAASGSELWKKTFAKAAASYCAGRGGVWISFADGEVQQLDRRTGEVVGTARLPRAASVWQIRASSVIAGSDDGSVWSLRLNSLEKQWYYASKKPVTAMAGTGKGVFVLGNGRSLVCLDTAE